MISVKFDTAALDRQLEGMSHAIKGALRPAAAAAAETYYNEVKMRASGIVDTGTLAASIYWKYIPELSGDGVRARYHISWRKGGRKAEKGLSALPIAYHGNLVEYGYIQRYKSYVGKDGQWYTQKKPGIKGKVPKYKGPKSGRQAHYDKFYVLRETPIQHAPRSFLRSGYEAVQDKAIANAISTLHDSIAGSQV